MSKKYFVCILCLFLVQLFVSTCRPKKQDDTLLNLLLLNFLLSSNTTEESSPEFEITEEVQTATILAGANFYGAGIPGYISNFITFSARDFTSKAQLVQAEHNHAVSGGRIDFVQSFSGGPQFYTRDTNSGQIGSVLHWYGYNTGLYTSNISGGAPVSVTPSGSVEQSFRVIVPSNTIPITIRKVRSLKRPDTDEVSFTPDSSTTDFSKRGMSRVWEIEKKMKFHLIFVNGANPSASEGGISVAINKLIEVYSQNTVKIKPIITSQTLNDPAYITLTSLSGSSTAPGSLGGLFANTASVQKADAVNIFFVKNETAVGGVLGVSGGLPGLPGKSGTRNSGMVVMFDSHLGTPGGTPTNAEQVLMGETIAHEAGHWLGLNHLVESNYVTTQTTYTRDAISETPLCTQAGLTLVGCDGTNINNSGSRNVMFYNGSAGFTQPNLTGEQGWVLRRHPLVF